MPEPTPRSPIADSPLSVILLGSALATDAQAGLHAWQQYLQLLHRPFEILLVQETRPEVSAEPPTGVARVLPYERSVGWRDALNEAVRSAQHPLLVFGTCDTQYQPSDLATMLKIVDQADLVVGFRVGQRVPIWRQFCDTVLMLLSRVLVGVPLGPTVCWLGSAGRGRRWLARWVFALRVNDPECPFRLARRTLFEHIPLQSQGSFAHIEMLAKANHLTCLIAEEPVTWTPAALHASEATAFSDDFWRVFRKPNFGVTPVSPPAPEPGTA